VLLRAEGPNFCYGGDLKSFRPALATLPTIVRDWTAELHMGLQRLWSLPAPVVCAAQGFVMGGGLSLAAGCDWVIAGESSRFGAAFGQIGFSCDSGTSITLTARLGAARAKRFTMLSEVIGAAEALQMGLVERVVADAKIAAEAMALAERLAAGPTVAYGEIKRLFARAGHTAFQAQLEDEAMTLARVSATEDAGEGVAAMMEKRKPVFKGR
jgi:2-(1,2-epoxy-1,2-dihydrophenyl)acetyl-CoA isomerase